MLKASFFSLLVILSHIFSRNLLSFFFKKTFLVKASVIITNFSSPSAILLAINNKYIYLFPFFFYSKQRKFNLHFKMPCSKYSECNYVPKIHIFVLYLELIVKRYQRCPKSAIRKEKRYQNAFLRVHC